MLDQPSSKPLGSPARAIGAAIALSPALVLTGAVMILNPGAQFERGLASAAASEARVIATNTPVRGSVPAAIANRTFEEGSEGFWLSRAADTGDVARVSWKAPVAAGDRVVVNFGPYDRRIIDVVSVEEVSPATTRIDTGVDKGDRYLITGRPLAGSGSNVIRLTVDPDGRGLTTISGPADRAL